MDLVLKNMHSVTIVRVLNLENFQGKKSLNYQCDWAGYANLVHFCPGLVIAYYVAERWSSSLRVPLEGYFVSCIKPASCLFPCALADFLYIQQYLAIALSNQQHQLSTRFFLGILVSSLTMVFFREAVFIALAPAALALVRPNSVGRLPALGWNSWNAYGCDINEAKFMDAANDMVSLGLKVSICCNSRYRRRCAYFDASLGTESRLPICQY
jgi:hypothetical protein